MKTTVERLKQIIQEEVKAHEYQQEKLAEGLADMLQTGGPKFYEMLKNLARNPKIKQNITSTLEKALDILKNSADWIGTGKH